MGRLTRLFGGDQPKPGLATDDMQPSIGNEFLLSGTTHYQAELRRSRLGAHRFLLKRQPDNPHDPRAVAVFIDGKALVGHISRTMASRYCDAIAKLESTGRSAWIHGKLSKAPGGGLIVHLDCPYPEEFV